MSVPTTTTPAMTQPVIQVRPAGLCFEVTKLEKLATKINGSAQYIFHVEFDPSPIAATPTQEKLTATIPLHAPTITQALMILQAYGKSLKDLTPAQLRERVANLQYHAVEITETAPGFEMHFTRYQGPAQHFESKPIITQRISRKEYEELEDYAKDLDSRHTPIDTVEPVVTLTKKAETPHVEITLTQRKQPSLKAKLKKDQEALSEALKGSIETQEKAVEAFNKVFGEDFKTKVFEDTTDGTFDLRPLEQRLYDEAYLRFVAREQDLEKQAEVLAELTRITKVTPERESIPLKQFFYLSEIMVRGE